MRIIKRMLPIVGIGLVLLALGLLLAPAPRATQARPLPAPDLFAEQVAPNLFPPPVVQMGSTHFRLDWNVVGSGGGKVNSSNFQVWGTAGQPTTGWKDSSHYKVHTGYWQTFGYKVFLPLIVKNITP